MNDRFPNCFLKGLVGLLSFIAYVPVCAVMLLQQASEILAENLQLSGFDRGDEKPPD